MASEGTAVVLIVVFFVLIVYVLADLEGRETPVSLIIATVLAIPTVILAVYILGSETFTLEDFEDDKPS